MPSRLLVLRAGYFSRQEQGRALSWLTGKAWYWKCLGEVLCRAAAVSCSAGSAGYLSIPHCLRRSRWVRKKREDPAGIPTSTSKKTLIHKPTPEAAALPHEECWLNCKRLWMKWLCCQAFSFWTESLCKFRKLPSKQKVCYYIFLMKNIISLHSEVCELFGGWHCWAQG